MIHLAVIILFVVVLVFCWGLGTYNSLVRSRNKTDYTWAQIDVVLKKRFDLVPGLVETVQGYAAHERETLARVVEARSRIAAAGTVADNAEANNMLTGALKSLFAVAEAYPELKANQSFLDFQRQLAEIEDKIAYQRQFYNDSVYAYNTLIQQVPSNIIASFFRFHSRELFNTEAEAERRPVKFSFDNK